MYIAVIRYLPIHLHQVICRLVYSDGITIVHLALLNVDTLYTNLNAHSRESCRYNNVFMDLKWNYKCHYLNFGSLNQTHAAMQYVLVCQTTLLCVRNRVMFVRPYSMIVSKINTCVIFIVTALVQFMPCTRWGDRDRSMCIQNQHLFMTVICKLNAHNPFSICASV